MSAVDKLDSRRGAGMVGVGAMACAACCASPVLGFLAGVGLTAAVGAVLLGIVGVVAALAVGAVAWRRRRARRRCSPAPTEPVQVETPRLRVRS